MTRIELSHLTKSYPRHFGREFAVFELLLDLVLLVYLLGPGLWRRLTRGAVAPQER